MNGLDKEMSDIAARRQAYEDMLLKLEEQRAEQERRQRIAQGIGNVASALSAVGGGNAPRSKAGEILGQALAPTTTEKSTDYYRKLIEGARGDESSLRKMGLEQEFQAKEKEVDRALKREEIGAKRAGDAASLKSDIIKRGTDLRKEYGSSDNVKIFNDSRPHLTQIDSIASKIESGKKINNNEDKALIVAIAKLADPKSVIRESEITLWSGDQAIGDKLQASLNQVKGSGILSEGSRRELLALARNYSEPIRQGYANERAKFKTFANDYGVEQKHIFGEKDEPVYGPPVRRVLKGSGKVIVLRQNLETGEYEAVD